MGARGRSWWASAAVAAAAAAAVASLSGRDWGRALDRSLFGRLNAGRGAATDRFFRGMTELGSIAGVALSADHGLTPDEQSKVESYISFLRSQRSAQSKRKRK